MKRFIYTLVSVVLLAGVAFANPFYFELSDTGFDYTDTDTEEAYIALSYVDGDLILSMDDSSLDTALPVIEVVVPDLDKEDFWGTNIGAEISDISEITLINSGSGYEGFSVMHPNTRLNTVVDSYVSELASIGFKDIVIENTTGNLEVCVFDAGDAQIRAVFTQQGDAVIAYLYAL